MDVARKYDGHPRLHLARFRALTQTNALSTQLDTHFPDLYNKKQTELSTYQILYVRDCRFVFLHYEKRRVEVWCPFAF